MKNFSFSFLSLSEFNSFKKVLSHYKPKHIFDKNRKYFDWNLNYHLKNTALQF